MADDNENELELDNSGKKKKMIIIIAIVAVLAIGGGVAFFMMSGGEDVSQADVDAALSEGAPASSDGAGATQGSAASVGTALYVPMPRPFSAVPTEAALP